MPIVLLPLSSAIIVNMAWGLCILTVLSYAMAKSQGKAPWKIVGEHVLIAVAVIAITHWVGDRVSTLGQ